MPFEIDVSRWGHGWPSGVITVPTQEMAERLTARRDLLDALTDEDREFLYRHGWSGSLPPVDRLR